MYKSKQTKSFAQKNSNSTGIFHYFNSIQTYCGGQKNPTVDSCYRNKAPSPNELIATGSNIQSSPSVTKIISPLPLLSSNYRTYDSAYTFARPSHHILSQVNFQKVPPKEVSVVSVASVKN